MRTLVLCCAISILFSVVEAIGGWFTHSLALLSDAGHMASDGFALAISGFAAWIASKPSSNRHSYGMGRAEVIAAWASSILMVLISINIFVEAVERLYQPTHVVAGTVILIGFIGIVVNLLMVWLLHRREKTLNVRSAILHVMSDLLGSFAALLSGVIIYFTDWFIADPILSILIAVLILISSIRLGPCCPIRTCESRTIVRLANYIAQALGSPLNKL